MMTTPNDAELALVERARGLLPAGGLGNVASDTIIARGRAGRVWDVSGREYVDLLLGSGPMLVGHAHPEVTQAVLEQVPLGTTFFANNEPAIRLAAEIVDAVACAEKVRFVSSGTEADLYAMRLARAFRRRDKILKFEGGYHGMSDYGLMSLWPDRPGNFPQAAPDSAGIPASVRDDVLVCPYNDLATAQDLIRAHHDEIGGVIVEPMQRLITPEPGFLQGLREITREYGIPLIFDEVVTGFRLAYGGAQEYYGVVPDICTLGKVIGGGFPLAAIAGRDDIMAHLDRGRVGADGLHAADRHAQRQSGGRRRRAGDPRSPAAARRLRAALRQRRGDPQRAWPRRCRTPGSRRRCLESRRCSTPCSAAAGSAITGILSAATWRSASGSTRWCASVACSRATTRSTSPSRMTKQTSPR